MIQLCHIFMFLFTVACNILFLLISHRELLLFNHSISNLFRYITSEFYLTLNQSKSLISTFFSLSILVHFYRWAKPFKYGIIQLVWTQNIDGIIQFGSNTGLAPEYLYKVHFTCLVTTRYNCRYFNIPHFQFVTPYF